jgi:hypothetical protein
MKDNSQTVMIKTVEDDRTKIHTLSKAVSVTDRSPGENYVTL